MPQIPGPENFNVMPQQVELPRLNADDFGAGRYAQLGKTSQAVAGIGDSINLIGMDISRANARNAFNQYKDGVNQVLNDNVYGLAPGDMVNGGLKKYYDGAQEVLLQVKDTLKNDPQAQGLLDYQVGNYMPSLTQKVMEHHAASLQEYEKQSAMKQLGDSVNNYVSEDDPTMAATHLKEVYGLTHGLIRGFPSAQPDGSLPESDVPYDAAAHEAAVKSVVAPALANEIHTRAESGDIDGALDLIQQKGDWLHPDVHGSMLSNLQQAKTTQAVSNYLNQAAHPDMVNVLASKLGDPTERAVAMQLAPSIAAKKQGELDNLNAQATIDQMKKIQANPGAYGAVTDSLMSDDQKNVLTTYRDKLLQDSAGPTPDDSAAWGNLCFMAVDNPRNLMNMDPMDVQHLLTGDHFGQLVKLQHDIRTNKFDTTPTQAVATLQNLIHSDSTLSTPTGRTIDGQTLYTITDAGHYRLASALKQLSFLPDEDQNNPEIIKNIWTQGK